MNSGISLFLSFSAGAIPLMVLFLLLYKFCLQANMGRLSLLAKCGGSFISVFAAGFFAWAQDFSPFSSLLFWGLVLCVIADALLDIYFIAGVAAFGLAHILFILRLFTLAQPGIPNLILWILLCALSIFLFRKEVRSTRNPILLVYPLVLTAMASLSITLPFTLGMLALPTAIGGILFTFSDFLVGKSFFDKKPNHGGAIIMTTYYAALYLFAVNVSFGMSV